MSRSRRSPPGAKACRPDAGPDPRPNRPAHDRPRAGRGRFRRGSVRILSAAALLALAFPALHAAQVVTPADIHTPDVARLVVDGRVFTGEVHDTHPDGTVRSIGRYVDGLRDGAQERFHPDGTRAALVSYVAGIRSGPEQRWHADGTLRFAATRVDDVLAGAVVWYHPGGTQKRYECTYSDGKRDGIARTWDEQGNLIEESHFAAGRRDGDVVKYHANGQRAYYCHYRDGRRATDPMSWDSAGNPLPQRP